MEMPRSGSSGLPRAPGTCATATAEGRPTQLWSFASHSDLPIAGDWKGDGKDDIGVFRPSTGTCYLTFLDNPTTVRVVHFASPGDLPVVGDWDGDGDASPGVFRNGMW